MPTEPLVSVIVPVYNVVEYLPLCLRSISEQTYRNLEIILVDDGSTDGSGAICDEFALNDSRAKVIHQPNSGLWAARNAGHEAANGEYLFFPDADDYFSPDLISLLFKAINSGNGCNLAICRMKMTSTSASVEDIPSLEEIKITEKTQDDLFGDLFGREGENQYAVFMWNKLFRASFVKGFRTNNYDRSQDKDYMIRLFFKLDKAVLVENKLYYWVQHQGSLSHEQVAWYLFHECRARICYSNLMNLPEEGRRFSHYLLDELYVRMLFWISFAWGKPEWNTVAIECAKMVKDTKLDYRRCREIPLWKRAVCLYLMRHRRLSYWLRRVSRN